MRFLRLLLLPAFLGLAACGSPHGPDGPPMGTRAEIVELERAILALGPGIDPEEARRAAEISYVHTFRLAQEYEITDPPLVHNTKVNMGLKPRGLCWHWAEDMEKRLKAERFETLEIHRAIANADNSFRIDHSTAIVSRRGDAFDEGIVLDPWRKGGVLFWSPLLEDDDYVWVEQSVVHARKRAEMIREAELQGLR